MTNEVFTDQHCEVCGTVVAKRSGVQVILGLICDNPLCSIQSPSSFSEQRDNLIAFSVNAGFSATSVAKEHGVSRQRVYQIMDAWRQGAAA